MVIYVPKNRHNNTFIPSWWSLCSSNLGLNITWNTKIIILELLAVTKLRNYSSDRGSIFPWKADVEMVYNLICILIYYYEININFCFTDNVKLGSLRLKMLSLFYFNKIVNYEVIK